MLRVSVKGVLFSARLGTEIDTFPSGENEIWSFDKMLYAPTRIRHQRPSQRENTLNTSLQRSMTPKTSDLDMKLNHLRVNLQLWSFGENGVPIHCHYSQVDSDAEW